MLTAVDQGPAAAGAAEGPFQTALRSLFAVAEAYPNLRASENFQALQHELAGTENRIAESRSHYNGSVRVLQHQDPVVPGEPFAHGLGFTEREYYEVAGPRRDPAAADRPVLSRQLRPAGLAPRPPGKPLIEPASSHRSEVEAGLAVPEPLGGDRVQVTLAQQDVLLAAHLDLGLVLGVEQHPVADLDGAHVRAHGRHPRPGQPAAHRGGGGDHDAAGRAALTGLGVERDQDPVVQHPDRDLVGPGIV